VRSVKAVCAEFTTQFDKLFVDLRSGLSAREDSRAFGAMIERRLIDNWEAICKRAGSIPELNPGRRTIYDFASKVDGTFFGFDVKTKDLDTTRYSDGGVCAVGNLLKFLANDRAIFVVVEFGHNKAKEGTELRDLEYILVAPFHLLPENTYRIENLGTGQVRLNYSINQIFDEIEWDRDLNTFFDIFTEIAIKHYERVGRDALKRADAIKRFKAGGYKRFAF
jgi:hypothetical protein